MKWLSSILATCRFEWSQFMTFQRIAVAISLALFPPSMLGMMLMALRRSRVGTGYELFISVLFISIVCLLGLFMWATPIVASELEGKSWIFNASRPRGRVSLLLGKYLAAVLFNFAICLIAVTLCLFLIQATTQSLRAPLSLWLKMNALYGIACLAYGAIYSLIGTLHYRRAMVIAAAYTIVSDFVLANIPALISRLTLRFHLQFLGLEWFGDFLPIPASQLKTEYLLPPNAGVGFHLACLGAVIVGCLLAASWVITHREYLTSDET